VESHWIHNENVSSKKITRINYGYNFGQYEKPGMDESEKIRKEFSTDLLIVSIARLVAAKRHILMFEAVQLALENGIDCKFLCIGTGPDKEVLSKWILHNKLEHKIFLLGYKTNIFDYLHAADVYLHLSSTEASNSSVKEAGLIACPSIVCAGVGDFQDYIENNVNGFLLNKNPYAIEVSELLISLSRNKEHLKKTGLELKKTVISRFDISRVEPQYDGLIASMN
jgi:glycosyltransferase involved in cell wall biosynthesis